MDVGCSRMRRLASTPSPLLHAKLVSRSSSSYAAAAAAAAPLLTSRASSGAGAHGFEFSPTAGKVLLKGMSYPELEKWFQCQGFRPGQALMLWKRLYGNDAWAHSSEELEGKSIIMVHEQGLHFSPRKVRNWIMPINWKFKIDALLQALREELKFKKNYKVLFKYVMLAEVIDFDSLEDVKRLVDLVQGIPCKINLIKFNPHC